MWSGLNRESPSPEPRLLAATPTRPPTGLSEPSRWDQGTSQVRDVLATQTIALQEMKVRRIKVVNGDLRPGVYAKDVILHIIRLLGANGGIGYAYEYAGNVFERMSMEERMTVCNMSIEGGARCGYVKPECGRP